MNLRIADSSFCYPGDKYNEAHLLSKEVEVKDEKDKKFKFEGGTVEYSDVGSANVGLIIGIALAVIPLLVGVGAALLMARRHFLKIFFFFFLGGGPRGYIM
jgi:hypothetical protein